MTSKSRLFRVFSLLLVCGLVFGLVMPALASDPTIVNNSNFLLGTNGSTTIPSWTNSPVLAPLTEDPFTSGTNPWKLDAVTHSVYVTSTLNTMAYLYQCIHITNPGNNRWVSTAKFGSSARASSLGGDVIINFYLTENCDNNDYLNGSPYDKQSYANGSSLSGYTPMNGGSEAAPSSIMVVLNCNGLSIQTSCDITNVFLNTNDNLATSVSLASIKGSSGQPWYLPAALVSVVLTGALAAAWQFRRSEKLD